MILCPRPLKYIDCDSQGKNWQVVVIRATPYQLFYTGLDHKTEKEKVGFVKPPGFVGTISF